MKVVSILIWLFVMNGSVVARMVEKSISTNLIQERVNGQLFCYRCEVVNGKKSEMWTIDSRSVDRLAYDEAILRAESKERQVQRQLAYDYQQRMHEIQASAQLTCYKKMLQTVLVQLEHELTKFNDDYICGFLAFRPDTIDSDKELSYLKQQIQEAHVLITQPTIEHMEDLQKLTTYLEPYGQRLQHFFYDTVHCAINECDDTKVLKELLPLIS